MAIGNPAALTTTASTLSAHTTWTNILVPNANDLGGNVPIIALKVDNGSDVDIDVSLDGGTTIWNVIRAGKVEIWDVGSLTDRVQARGTAGAPTTGTIICAGIC